MLVGVLAISACTKTEAAATADSSKATATAAPAVAATDPNAARHAIDSIYAKFTDALARGDAKALGATYASNAIASFPGAPLFTGADVITKAFEHNFTQASIQNPKLHTDDIITSGDLVVENGTWSWTAQPRNGGKAEVQNGHYLTVWQHQADGTWKMARDYVTADPTK
ncbi:MAG TPA: nuclear transport factor 2 family protein [Candidatus Elarobacter sp.]|nr:nuclear transport factor 2 family protein [Candidatus Elarobacter sp.]